MGCRRINNAGRRLPGMLITVAFVFGTLCGNSFGAGTKTKADFYDIKGHWAETAIEAFISKGIIRGVSANGVLEAMPDKSISRAEFVAMVVRTFDLKPVAANIKSFRDEKKGAWYNDALKTATSNALLAGYPDGGFHPDDPVTNGQVNIILTRLRNQQLKAVNRTVDGSWYAANVLTEVKAELKRAPASGFSPGKNATRAETLAALYGYMSVAGKEDVKTAGQSAGSAARVVGNSGTGNDPVSILGAATAGTGSAAGSGTGGADSKGAAGALPEPSGAGVTGYQITAAKGELVYFQIYAYALKELGGFDFKISYDPGVVVATSVRNGSIKAGEYLKSDDVDMSQAAAGTVLVRSRDASPVTGSDGTLFTVVFRVQPQAAGSTTITMKSSSSNAPLLYSAGGTAISPLTCTEGRITVK